MAPWPIAFGGIGEREKKELKVKIQLPSTVGCFPESPLGSPLTGITGEICGAQPWRLRHGEGGPGLQ